jgi:hypothetical protein
MFNAARAARRPAYVRRGQIDDGGRTRIGSPCFVQVSARAPRKPRAFVLMARL